MNRPGIEAFKSAVLDLEGDFGDLWMLTMILAEVVETDTGRIFEKTKEGKDRIQMVVSRDNAERLAWLAGEVCFRMRKLRADYYAAIDGRSGDAI